MSISIKGVSKRFGKFTAVDGVSIEIATGSLTALLGPSGSGKTTLLRIIAGLEPPDAGTVHYGEEDATHRPPRERNVGFVFQHYALFRHMNVFENIAFGLRVRRWPRDKVRARVGELLQLIQLTGLENRYPSQLSGGQRQRVALARALAPEPKLLLLDEPFGALDARVRQELRLWLRRLHDDLHVTSVFVTHDQQEAFETADQVVVMQRGRVEQIGSPTEVFEHPANPFVMSFLGNVNIFHGRVHDGHALLEQPLRPAPAVEPSKVYVRPHELEIRRIPNGVPSLRATVIHVRPAGAVAKVQLVSEGFEAPINVDLSPENYQSLALRAGDMVHLSPRNYRVFEPDYSI
ncbi:MAG TPA: sulfate ABC transporter ATP-binding protein [Gemmataceae bacterium]|jgi:sulfate transport system ATP-binding protein|nr:sulfate ABC transporter ATP-binding protein [Gemmataceae bacterium]